MSIFKPSTPKPAPLPAPPPPPPTLLDNNVQTAYLDAQKRAASIAGRNSTVKTSPLGLQTNANSAYKTLLGV